MTANQPEGNPNIQVELTDAHEFHCFRLVLNPKSAPLGEVSACHGVPVLQSPLGAVCVQCAQVCEIEIPSTGRVEIMLHARSLVDLIHKCSEALCEWQAQTTAYLIERLTQPPPEGPT